jgi:hypothetical protein
MKRSINHTKKSKTYYNINTDPTVNKVRVEQHLNAQQARMWNTHRYPEVREKNPNILELMRGIPGNVSGSRIAPNNREDTQKKIRRRIRNGERETNTSVKEKRKAILENGNGHTLLPYPQSETTYEGPGSNVETFETATGHTLFQSANNHSSQNGFYRYKKRGGTRRRKK